MKLVRLLALSLVLLGCAATPADEPPVYVDTSQTPNAATAELLRTAMQALNAGDHEAAAEGFRAVVEGDPSNGRAWHLLGFSLHSLGRLDEALPAHRKAARSSNPGIASMGAYNAGCVYALKGDKDEAFAWLGRAVDAGFRRLDQLEADPDLDSLRTDPRFEELVRSIEG